MVVEVNFVEDDEEMMIIVEEEAIGEEVIAAVTATIFEVEETIIITMTEDPRIETTIDEKMKILH